MQTLVSFSENDLERLFLTYKRNFKNYSKIKDKVIGKDAALIYKRNRKSSIFFFIALTFIIVVSSAFSLIADHMNSFVALWMIWGIAAVIFSFWFIAYYRNSFKILQQNQAFFDKFEAVASNNDSLDAFRMNW
ncbi:MULTISPECIES: hypothetical protein [unclassified Aureispira]|uniref:hypothetical protein n=1 Tax=unclassified Aureispira TaxID=2649989 RepID=UPI000698B6A6|nr:MULTISPECIES: hypothetical protein [unclassified Aureispira]WMX13740.1 hypothetical protein QP953_23090 [Aureispira sp. CCB-E]